MMSQALSMFESTISTPVTNARAALNTAPPGAVQSGYGFDALASASVNLLQVAADALHAFNKDFESPISEALSAGILAASIIADIEGASPIS
jgi:hypothetical protein